MATSLLSSHATENTNVFHKWSEEEKAKSSQGEMRLAKLWRKIGYIAGLDAPMGPADYQQLLKEYGSDEAIRRKYLTKNLFRAAKGKMRNMSQAPFDLYTLIKKCSFAFLSAVGISYFLVLSAFFSFVGNAAGCFDVDAGNFLPKGFLMISALGYGIEQSTTCLWLECFSTFAGCYLTLPIIGAVVLVRLLDNTSVCFEMSDVLLLGMRRGRPMLSWRSISKTGELYSNRQVKVFFAVKHRDPTTGENYSESVMLELPSPDVVQAFAIASTYVIEADDDPLIAKGVVTFDEQGRPVWNFKQVAIVWITMTADKDMGSRNMSHTQFYLDVPHHLIHREEESGAFPIWKSCSSSMFFAFLPSKGKSTTVSDISMLSHWEYSPQQLQQYKDNQATLKVEQGQGQAQVEEEEETHAGDGHSEKASGELAQLLPVPPKACNKN